MKRRILGPLLFTWAACADDSLVSRTPELYITPYEPENYVATEVLDGVNVIDLGDVAVYSTRIARYRLQNPTTQVLVINAIDYARDDAGASTATGADWLAPSLDGDPNDLTIGANQSRIVSIPYGPVVEGGASADVRLVSNAGNGRNVTVRVLANGVYSGAPDIAVRYYTNQPTAPTGPGTTECDSEGLTDNNGDLLVGGCLLVTPFDMGGVALGGETTAKLYLLNEAACDPAPGAEECGTCVLTLRKDTTRQNLGVGFKNGSNANGYFSIQGSTATPFDLPMQDPDCGLSNYVTLLIKFTAPASEGDHEAVLVVESNDPDEPLIEVPIKAAAVNKPVAIADLRALDPSNPSAPYSVAGDVEPLDRVYLDGRAKGTNTSTHDPRDPADTSLISSYLWEVVEAPTGVNPNDYAPQGQGSGLFSFFVPLAGHYVVRLTVQNVDGLTSLDNDAARVEFDAIPSERMHIQLVWDDASNDQDLHLTYANVDDRVCNEPYDCHWLNKDPVWFGSYAAGVGPNPRLDIDDTNGLGPENINIDDPQPGTYRVYVHYYTDYTTGSVSATLNTLRIWLNGVQVAEYKRSLNAGKATWAAVDITWFADNTGTVTPYPSDTAGQVGAVDTMEDCDSPGWTFP